MAKKLSLKAAKKSKSDAPEPTLREMAKAMEDKIGNCMQHWGHSPGDMRAFVIALKEFQNTAHPMMDQNTKPGAA